MRTVTKLRGSRDLRQRGSSPVGSCLRWSSRAGDPVFSPPCPTWGRPHPGRAGFHTLLPLCKIRTFLKLETSQHTSRVSEVGDWIAPSVLRAPRPPARSLWCTLAPDARNLSSAGGGVDLARHLPLRLPQCVRLWGGTPRNSCALVHNNTSSSPRAHAGTPRGTLLTPSRLCLETRPRPLALLL